MKVLKYFILVVSLMVGLMVQAQEEDCAFKLREAQQLYDNGKIETVPELLQPCIQRGFTQEERLQAFKLIIMCEIYDDDEVNAHAEMLSFLKRYPEYELSPTDPAEFRFIFQQYRTRPMLDLGLIVGANMSHGLIVQPFSPFNLNEEKPKYTSNGFGIQAGALINFYITSQIEICLEPMYAQSKMQLVYENGAIPGFEDDAGDLTPDHFENQSYLYIPLTATYEMAFGNFRPYARLGGMLGLMLTDKTSTSQGIFQGPDEDNMENRKPLNYWVVGGLGAKYKLSKGYFYLDARYNFGLNRYLSSGDDRYTQENHNWIYMYQDSDFRVNSTMVSFGYVRSFYNPKRVRN